MEKVYAIVQHNDQSAHAGPEFSPTQHQRLALHSRGLVAPPRSRSDPLMAIIAISNGK